MEVASLYQPLDTISHEIRLLQILPPQNDAEALECLLETVSLDTSPKYFALSYEWEKYPPEQPHPKVLVHSQEIPVKANLALAISRLWELGNGERYWVDALCINQEDDVERAQQVRIMTRIYENSSGVYSWLGLEDGKSYKAIDFVQGFHRTFPVRPSRGNLVAQEMTHWIKQKLSDPSYQEHWEGLNELCQRTYWKRVWVIQEIVVTEKHQGVRLLCGIKEMLLWPFHTLVFLAGGVTLNAAYGSHLESWWAISRQLRSSSMVISAIIRHAEAWGEQKLDEYNLGLLRLLEDHARAQCTDLRDNVYALLGVSLPYEGLELEINYSIPVSRVFLNAAQYIIRGSKNLLMLLHYGKHSSELSNLPSWVPDWSGTYSDPPIISSLNSGFDACGSTLADTKFSSDGTKLTAIRSIILGTVTELNDGEWWGLNLENVPRGNATQGNDFKLATDELCRWINFARRSIQGFETAPSKHENEIFLLSPDELARVFFDAVLLTLPPEKPRTLLFEKFRQLCNYLCELVPSSVQCPDITEEHLMELCLAFRETRKLCAITLSTPLLIKHPDTGQGRESGPEDNSEKGSEEESESDSICGSQCSQCFPGNGSSKYSETGSKPSSNRGSDRGSEGETKKSPENGTERVSGDGSGGSENGFECGSENDFKNDPQTGSGSDSGESSQAAIQEYWTKTIGVCSPKRAMVNDMAVVVRGCEHPLLVRKKETGYELLGELYVHGVMFGEAMEGFPEMDIEFI